MTDSESIDLSRSPIRHDSLSADLLEQILAVYEVFGPFLGTTLEQFEITFMRESSPEQEVAVWCTMAAAWLAYHEQFLGGALEPVVVEKKLIAALVSISSGVDDLEALGVPVDVGRKLLACYDSISEE